MGPWKLSLHHWDGQLAGTWSPLPAGGAAPKLMFLQTKAFSPAPIGAQGALQHPR